MSGYGNLGFSNYTAPSGMMSFASNYPSQYPTQPLPQPNNLQFISASSASAPAVNPVNYNQAPYPSFYYSAPAVDPVTYNQSPYPYFYSAPATAARPYGPVSPPYQFNQNTTGAIKNPSTLLMLLLLKNTQKAPVVEPPVLSPEPVISSGNDFNIGTPTQPPTKNFLALLMLFLQRKNSSSPSTPTPTPDPIVELPWIPTPKPTPTTPSPTPDPIVELPWIPIAKPTPTTPSPTPDPIVELPWIPIAKPTPKPKPTPRPEMIAINESAAYWGDPHVVDPDRKNKAENRGVSFDITEPGEFNLLKDKGVSLTAKQDLFPQWQLSVATEINLKLKENALSLNGGGASLNGKALKEGEIVKLKDGTEVKWAKDQLTATNTNKTEYDFSFKLNKTDLKDKDGKPIHYIDTDVKTKGKGVAADGVKPTGILGEGFDADNKERTKLNKPLDAYRVSDYKAPKKDEATAAKAADAAKAKTPAPAKTETPAPAKAETPAVKPAAPAPAPAKK
jgi:hypothetical protein